VASWAHISAYWASVAAIEAVFWPKIPASRRGHERARSGATVNTGGIDFGRKKGVIRCQVSLLVYVVNRAGPIRHLSAAAALAVVIRM
jgi:hypothetical protein